MELPSFEYEQSESLTKMEKNEVRAVIKYFCLKKCLPKTYTPTWWKHWGTVLLLILQLHGGARSLSWAEHPQKTSIAKDDHPRPTPAKM